MAKAEENYIAKLVIPNVKNGECAARKQGGKVIIGFQPDNASAATVLAAKTAELDGKAHVIEEVSASRVTLGLYTALLSEAATA